MKIAIDFDNTLFSSSSFIIEAISKFHSYLIKEKSSNKKMKNLQRSNIITDYRQCKTDAAQTIAKLKADGHEILILSTRPAYKFLIKKPINFLKENHIVYDDIVMGCKNKADYCMDHGIDVLIDDCTRHCQFFQARNKNALIFNFLEEKKQKNKAFWVTNKWDKIYAKIKERSATLSKKSKQDIAFFDDANYIEAQ